MARGFIGLSQATAYGDNLAAQIYKGFAAVFLGLCRGRQLLTVQSTACIKPGKGLVRFIGAGGAVDSKINTLYSTFGRGALRGISAIKAWEGNLAVLFKKTGLALLGGVRKLDGVERKFSVLGAKEKQGKLQRLQKAIRAFSGRISRSNIELLLAVIILAVMIIIFILYSPRG